jgi:hypothetical protein
VGIGLLAAVASAASAKKKEQSSQRRAEPFPGPRNDTWRYDNQGYDDRPRDDRYSGSRNWGTEEDAVNACAVAAREKATRNGGFADIRDVNEVRVIQHGWSVNGRIDQRQSYRDDRVRGLNFDCIYEDGRVVDVAVK